MLLGGAGTGLALILSDALQCTHAEQWPVRLVHRCITQFGNAVTWQGAVVIKPAESETNLTKEGEFTLLNHVETRSLMQLRNSLPEEILKTGKSHHCLVYMNYQGHPREWMRQEARDKSSLVKMFILGI